MLLCLSFEFTEFKEFVELEFWLEPTCKISRLKSKISEDVDEENWFIELSDDCLVDLLSREHG